MIIQTIKSFVNVDNVIKQLVDLIGIVKRDVG
jgi:hypothetical protein